MGRCVWHGDDEFSLDGVRYRSMAGHGGLVVVKPKDAITALESLVDELQPQRLLELGIYAGGSTALLAQLAHPQRLVALDNREQPAEHLERFIDEHHLRGSVSAHYGVDQANTAQLDELLTLFDGPLDLVVDDASHLEAQTRASFDHLFPHVRPGGVYLIEDWTWPHRGVVHPDAAYQGTTPLSALVLDLVLLSAAHPRIIPSVSITQDWALVRRGPADLRPGRFTVARNLDVLGRDMAERVSLARTLKQS